MIGYVVIAAALLAGTPVKIADLEGRTISGSLAEVDRAGVGYLEEQEKGRVGMDVLLAVTFERPQRPTDRPTGSLELLDHTLLAVTAYRAQGGTAHVALAGGIQADIPTKIIHWVRFQPPGERNAKLARQWADALASQPAADMLVVRKKGSLDYLEGVLGDVNDEGTQFTADNEPLSVPKTKIEGLVYFHAKPEESPEPMCKAIDVYGSALFARDLLLKDGKLEITTSGGLVVAVPIEAFAKLDFSIGKIQYLSDLEPESARYTPFFGPAKELPAVSEFYALRRDISFDQSPLQLDGKKYAKGLALTSRTAAVYRLPGRFSRFKAVAGIDDSVREGGDVHVEIKGDGKTLWQGTLKGNEKPTPLDLDVAGVRRLEILTDFGDDLDVADRLDLCDARVTK